MAISVASDRTPVNTTGGDAESYTNWTETAAWTTAGVIDGDMYLQGSNCIGARASAAAGPTEAVFWSHLTTGTANLNLTGYHLYFWIKCITIASMDTRARGGIGLSVSSTAAVALDATAPWTTLPWRGITDSSQWFLTGSDFETTSGWVCYVVDPFSTPDFSRNTPVMTSVDRIGIRAAALQVVGAGSFKPKNILWDYLSYQTKLTITGSTGTFQDIFTADSTVGNQYGILRKAAGVFLGGGKLVFGTTGQSAPCVFTDTKQTLVWQDMRVASGFYEIQLVGNTTPNVTTVTLGTYAGGLASGGCTIRGVGLDTRRLIAPVIVSGGTTYVVGDILTVVGGTYTTAAQFEVYAVATGVITAIVMKTAGSYSIPPTGTLTVTDARNSSATFTATVVGGSIWTLTASDANQTLNIYGSTLSEMLSASLASTSTWRGNTIVNSGTITANGSLIDNCTFQDLRTATPISATYQVDAVTAVPTLTNCKFVNCATALRWPIDTFDTNGKLDGTTFISGGTGHAIEFTGTATSRTLTNVTFTGYSGTSTNAAVYVNISSGNMTLTIAGTGTDITGNVRTAGATVTVVAGTKTVTVSVVDVDGVAVTGTNVFLRTAASGALPYLSSVSSITRSGTTATVTHATDHGMITDDKVLLAGITDKVEDNAVFTITKTGATTYTYTTTDSGSTNYTGATKTATFVYLKGNATGGAGSNTISMTRSISSSQSAIGWARKGSSAPYYKTGPISGTVSSTADTPFTAVMISDT